MRAHTRNEDLICRLDGMTFAIVMPGLVSTEFAKNALGSTGATAPPWNPGSSGMKPQTAEEVADAVAGLVEHPVAELYTNPISAPMAKRYFEDVGAFEEGMRGPR